MTENEYRAMNERIAPTPALEARTLERMEETRRAGKRRRPARRVLAAAMAVVLALGLAVGAGAAGYGPAARLFAPLLAGSESQVELIEQLSVPIEGVSDTQAGVTVSADALVSDGENLFIYYTFRREDGEPLIPADAEPGGVVTWGYGNMSEGIGEGSRQSSFLDLSPGKIEAHYLGIYQAKQGYPVTFMKEFGELVYRYGETYDKAAPFAHPEDITEDTRTFIDSGMVLWRVEVPLPQEQESMTKEVPTHGETFSKNGINYVVTGLEVSPLSVTVYYDTTNVKPSEEIFGFERKEYEDGSNGQYYSYDPRPYITDMSLILRLKDGREIDNSGYMSDFGNWMPMGSADPVFDEDAYPGPQTGKDLYRCSVGGSLPEAVPLEEMDAVIFNGIEYPVNP